MKIGQFLVEKGVLHPEQVQEVLSYSGRTGMRFGEAALELKLLTREQLVDVFGPGFQTAFFHLDTDYFPAQTRDLITLSEALQYGVLPLGYKTEAHLLKRHKVLNLGFLDPSKTEQVKKVESLVLPRAAKETQGIKIFLVLADQFLTVLRDHYGLSDGALQSVPSDALDPILCMELGR